MNLATGECFWAAVPGVWGSTAPIPCDCPACRRSFPPCPSPAWSAQYQQAVGVAATVYVARQLCDTCAGSPAFVDLPGRLTAAGIPKTMQDWTLASYPAQESKHLKEARTWVAQPLIRYDVVAFGPHGTGKTSLAVAVLHALLERSEHGGLFTTMRDILLDIRAGYARDDGSELWTLRRYMLTPVLVIDEVGATKGDSEHGEQTLSYLLDGRQAAARRTILTTNLDVQSEMSLFVGPRTWDRLREHAAFWSFSGASKRPTHRRPA